MSKVKLKNKRVILFSVVLIGLSSCVSKKNIIYFQNDEINQEKVSNNYQTVFKSDDLLQITVSAEDIEVVKPFNLPSVAFSSTTNSATGISVQQSYLIDSKGEIDFPILGKLKLVGLTKEEGITLLRNKISPKYVKNTTINIRISNFKITITGDVKNPGTYTLPNERVSILDAIGMAGDLNISGQRDNILVVREEGTKKVTYRVDLRSNNIYTSPVYYLQQNDVIYVEPNRAKIQSASSNANTGLYISVTSIIITILTLLTR